MQISWEHIGRATITGVLGDLGMVTNHPATIFIGGMEIPFPVMGGKHDIVLMSPPN